MLCVIFISSALNAWLIWLSKFIKMCINKTATGKKKKQHTTNGFLEIYWRLCIEVDENCCVAQNWVYTTASANIIGTWENQIEVHCINLRTIVHFPSNQKWTRMFWAVGHAKSVHWTMCVALNEASMDVLFFNFRYNALLEVIPTAARTSHSWCVLHCIQKS